MSAITAPQSREVTTRRRTGRPQRVRTALAVGAASVGVAAVLGTAAPAHADSYIASVRFHTTVECGGSTMLFSTNTVRDNGSYAKLFVWDAPTGRWVTDNVWQDASAWASFHAAGITFRPGDYSVYMQYAQYTTAGWQYSGEYIKTYRQRSGYSSWNSSTCHMG